MVKAGVSDIERATRPVRDILVIFEKFPPFTVSGSWRPFFFVKHLPEFGYVPHVISAEPEAGNPIDESLTSTLDPRCRFMRKRLWVRTTWQALIRPFRRSKEGPAQPPGRPAVSAEADAENQTPRMNSLGSWLYHAFNWRLHWYLDWAGPVLSAGLLAACRRRFDLIWVSGPHSRNLFAGYWLAVLLRKPLVIDLRDPWTYGSLWSPATNDVAKAERRWARRILRRAARIVFTSPFTMREMQNRFPELSADKLRTITNGFNDADVAPLRNASRDVCLFRYVGSLNTRRTPDVILEALRMACDANPELAQDIRFEFIGGMAGHESKIDTYGLAEVVSDVGRVSFQDSVRMIRGADVNVLLQTITEGQDVVSGKAFDYLAARKPILAVVSESGGDAWLVSETNSGVVAPFDDANAVRAAIEQCWKKWKSGAGDFAIGEDVLAKYSRRSLTKQLAELLDDVLAETKQ